MSQFSEALGRKRPGPQTDARAQRNDHLRQWVKQGYRTIGDQGRNPGQSPKEPRSRRGDDN